MAFFMDSEIPSADKIMEVFYILMGLMSVYAGVHNLRDRSNPSRYGTFVFWTLLGVVIAFGRWIPAAIDGLLIVIMVIPAIAQRVKPGNRPTPRWRATSGASGRRCSSPRSPSASSPSPAR